jgi:hypothetical protein
MSNSFNYNEKYLKYKTKYNKLKKQLGSYDFVDLLRNTIYGNSVYRANDIGYLLPRRPDIQPINKINTTVSLSNQNLVNILQKASFSTMQKNGETVTVFEFQNENDANAMKSLLLSHDIMNDTNSRSNVVIERKNDTPVHTIILSAVDMLLLLVLLLGRPVKLSDVKKINKPNESNRIDPPKPNAAIQVSNSSTGSLLNSYGIAQRSPHRGPRRGFNL